MRISVLLTMTIAALAPIDASVAEEPEVELSTGLEYRQGDFGTGSRIETVTASNSVRVQSGRVHVYASLPWHRIESPGNVVSGGGGLLGVPILTDATRPPERSVRQGIGDLQLGAGYTLAAPAGIDLTLVGEVKLPTASAGRGLGTGDLDLSVGGEASRAFGPVTLFGGVSYTLPGAFTHSQAPSSLAGRGGVAVLISPALRGHVSYGQARGLDPSIEEERQLSAGIVARLSDRLSLGVSGGAGLSEKAPDLGAAVRIGWRLF